MYNLYETYNRAMSGIVLSMSAQPQFGYFSPHDLIFSVIENVRSIAL